MKVSSIMRKGAILSILLSRIATLIPFQSVFAAGTGFESIGLQVADGVLADSKKALYATTIKRCWDWFQQDGNPTPKQIYDGDWYRDDWGGSVDCQNYNGSGMVASFADVFGWKNKEGDDSGLLYGACSIGLRRKNNSSFSVSVADCVHGSGDFLRAGPSGGVLPFRVLDSVDDMLLDANELASNCQVKNLSYVGISSPPVHGPRVARIAISADQCQLNPVEAL